MVDPNEEIGALEGRPAGSERTTSHDVARASGVSQSTVSRALRGDPRVTAATQERVTAAARRLNYRPNAAARSLITRKTQTVGVLVSEITNPFYPQIVEEMHNEFALSGYRTLLLNEGSDRLYGEGLIDQLHAGAVDGVVLMTVTLESADFLREAVPILGMPAVLLNREVDGVAIDRVVSDNHAGGVLAAEALVEYGHRRIALISGPTNTSTGRDRDAGFRAGLARHGLSVPDALRRTGQYTHQSGYQGCLELLAVKPRPTAIFCANDVVAFGALDAAKRAGVRTPQELSIIGYDDIEMAGWEVFSLTTIRQPLAQMAKAAARALLRRMQATAPTPPERLIFPPGLIRRETTASAPTVD